MKKALFVLDRASYDVIYPAPIVEEIARMVDVYAPLQDSAVAGRNPGVLRDAEIIMSGWGAPVMDGQFLAAAPNVRAVFYGAGSIRGVVTDAFWDRGIAICSAWGANAVPVAEYTLSQILFCLKRGWHFATAIRRDRRYPPRDPVPGGYGSTVGIISLGMIGRRVCTLLRHFDVKVIAYDPYVAKTAAAEMNVEMRSLEDVFAQSDVVSLHTPWLKETEGMIRGDHFSAMKTGASFINTARGAVVRESEMIEVLQHRPDIQAILDVTHPEPPEAGSPLYSMDNVVITPHIAGSMDSECGRHGRYMADELKRYLAGKPLKWQVTRAVAATMA